jgi:hypothetical protein
MASRPARDLVAIATKQPAQFLPANVAWEPQTEMTSSLTQCRPRANSSTYEYSRLGRKTEKRVQFWGLVGYGLPVQSGEPTESTPTAGMGPLPCLPIGRKIV